MGDAINVAELVEDMALQLSSRNLADPLLIGIHTGGAWLAQLLHRRLALSSAPGVLDISFYRDDFSRVGLNPRVRSSELPESVEDRNVILIDDVLYTGRTIRAAMNEIFSYGRPATITLGVLVDRRGRELPIQPDVAGCRLELEPGRQARLEQGAGGLVLNVVETG